MNARTATDLDLIHSKMRKRASGLYSWANQNKQYPALGNYMAYSNNSPKETLLSGHVLQLILIKEDLMILGLYNLNI